MYLIFIKCIYSSLIDVELPTLFQTKTIDTLRTKIIYYFLLFFFCKIMRLLNRIFYFLRLCPKINLFWYEKNNYLSFSYDIKFTP